MTRSKRSIPDQDDYYMAIAMAVRARANCTGFRVGAVIVRGNRIISTGYNGTPDGMTNCLEGGCLRCANREKKYPSGTAYDLCICVHAEQNALLAASRFGISVAGATLYTTVQPCFGCMKEMLQAHITKVVYRWPWKPTQGDAMDKLAEYEKLANRFQGGLKSSSLDDSDADWALPTPPVTEGQPDEHGHESP